MYNEEIEVSVFCLCFNHEKYIRNTLEGFINQKTQFRFEVLIHDDAFTDHSKEIVQEYAENYPQIIKTIMQTENQYSKGIQIIDDIIYPHLKGKYIAVCEGDDYWCDPYKLQKQFDIMESHPECSICTHAVQCCNEDGTYNKRIIPELKYKIKESRIIEKRELAECYWERGGYMENSYNIKKKIFTGLFWKFGERITAQLISLIVSILLARLLSPNDYGAVAIVMVFISLANVFVSNGFGNALVQKKDADNLDFSSVFYINILFSLFLYSILFFVSPIIAEFYSMPILSPVLRVLGIRIVIAAVNSVQQAYISRNMLFKRFFWSTLFGTMISGIVGIIMAYHEFGIWALATQYLINTCTDTIILWFTVRWRPDFKCSWSRAVHLLAYSWKLLVSGLIDTGYRQLRSLIIGKKYTSSDLAYYNQGDKYPSLIVVNINTSISSVLFPAMSQYQQDREKIKQMTRRAIQVTSYIMWPLMIGLGVAAEPLIKIILTEKWLPCVPYLRIFCFTYGLWPIHTANLQAMNALGRSDIFLKLEIIKKGIGLVALIISMQISPLAMACSLIVTDIISIFVNAAPNTRLIQYHYLEQIKDLFPPLFMSLVMAVFVYPVSFLPIADIFIIALQIIMGIIIYLIESLLFKQQTFYYLAGFIKKK